MFRRLLALAVFVVALAAATPSLAVTVTLRVEGASTTLFEGPVETSPHVVKGQTCDGTNGGANPAPGPTMTGALDSSGLSWDGTWYDSFQDFAVDRIGPDSSDLVNFRFWGLVLNFQTTQIGGCQQQVKAGDEVLFAYDLFSASGLLRLSGPAVAATGQPFTVTVADGTSGAAVGGASVGSATTDASGAATVSFAAPGTHSLKASKAGAIRSNAISVCVYDIAAGGCGIAATPPAGTAGSTPPTSTGTPPPGEPVQPLSGTGAESGGASSSCHELSIRSRPIEPGQRVRLAITVALDGDRADGVQLRVRGRGVDVRVRTGANGVARISVTPRGETLRVGVVGEMGRCGQERLR